MNTRERFWKKVDAGLHDACWEWSAAIRSDGYGAFRFQGKTCLAHRVSWRLANGPIPNGLCVLHRCDNPACVNPAHLFLGTQGDNIQDAVRKERIARGEDNGNSKLTADEVIMIRGRTDTYQAIAEDFDISIPAVYLIKDGKRWGWLDA